MDPTSQSLQTVEVPVLEQQKLMEYKKMLADNYKEESWQYLIASIIIFQLLQNAKKQSLELIKFLLKPCNALGCLLG